MSSTHANHLPKSLSRDSGDKPPMFSSRRTVIIGAGALLASVGVGRYLTGNGEGVAVSTDEPVGGELPDAKISQQEMFNGMVRNPELYAGRIDPNDLVGKTDAELEAMMTIEVDESATDREIAEAFVYRWEGATNAAAAPLAAQDALKNGGFVLNSGDESAKSIGFNYEIYQRTEYGKLFDYLTSPTYDGYDTSEPMANMMKNAEVTAHNYGNQIAIDPESYGASPDVTTYITVDSVGEADTELHADKKLDIGFTMTFAGPYKDKLLSGHIHLLLNKDGDRYETTVSYLDLEKPEDS